MGVTHRILPHYTIKDWEHWEGLWELIDGHPIAMAPSPVPRHQRVAAEIRYQIMAALKATGCRRCRAYDPIDYVISEDTILVPDIVVVCGEIKNRFLDFAPVMAVEILSPSTALRDRNTKYQLYEAQGVMFYLIVDADRGLIEVYERVDGEYKLRPSDAPHHFTLDTDCTITPNFTNVFDA